jgi:hypothetical protein
MEDRRALRGYVTDEVKRTNGQIRFEGTGAPAYLL